MSILLSFLNLVGSFILQQTACGSPNYEVSISELDLFSLFLSILLLLGFGKESFKPGILSLKGPVTRSSVIHLFPFGLPLGFLLFLLFDLLLEILASPVFLTFWLRISLPQAGTGISIFSIHFLIRLVLERFLKSKCFLLLRQKSFGLL